MTKFTPRVQTKSLDSSALYEICKRGDKLPRFDLETFNKHLKEDKLFNIYLLHGEEKYFISLYTDALINTTLGKNFLDFNFHKLDGNKLDINFIADLVWTLPVMSNKRCILINDLNIESLNKSDVNKFNELLSNLPDTTVFIISLKTIEINLKKSSAWKNLISKIQKVGAVVEFPKLNENSLSKKLINEAKLRNCTLNEKNAIKLIRVSGTDLKVLLNELEKLCSFKLNDEITDTDIDKLATKSLEANVFALSKAIINGCLYDAYSQLDQLFDNKEEPIAILAILTSTYIDIFRCKVALKSGKEALVLSDIYASEYKGREFKLKNASRYSRKFTYKQLGESLRILMETDLKLKSTQIDKKILIQSLLTKLFLISKGESVND